MRFAELLEAWSDLVGPAVAAVVRVHSFTIHGHLRLSVPTDALRAEFAQPAKLDALQQALPAHIDGVRIRRVHVVVITPSAAADVEVR